MACERSSKMMSRKWVPRKDQVVQSFRLVSTFSPTRAMWTFFFHSFCSHFNAARTDYILRLVNEHCTRGLKKWTVHVVILRFLRLLITTITAQCDVSLHFIAFSYPHNRKMIVNCSQQTTWSWSFWEINDLFAIQGNYFRSIRFVGSFAPKDYPNAKDYANWILRAHSRTARRWISFQPERNNFSLPRSLLVSCSLLLRFFGNQFSSSLNFAFCNLHPITCAVASNSSKHVRVSHSVYYFKLDKRYHPLLRQFTFFSLSFYRSTSPYMYLKIIYFGKKHDFLIERNRISTFFLPLHRRWWLSIQSRLPSPTIIIRIL